jgi:hypothetical protein
MTCYESAHTDMPKNEKENGTTILSGSDLNSRMRIVAQGRWCNCACNWKVCESSQPRDLAPSRRRRKMAPDCEAGSLARQCQLFGLEPANNRTREPCVSHRTTVIHVTFELDARSRTIHVRWRTTACLFFHATDVSPQIEKKHKNQYPARAPFARAVVRNCPVDIGVGGHMRHLYPDHQATRATGRNANISVAAWCLVPTFWSNFSVGHATVLA